AIGAPHRFPLLGSEGVHERGLIAATLAVHLRQRGDLIRDRGQILPPLLLDLDFPTQAVQFLVGQGSQIHYCSCHAGMPGRVEGHALAVAKVTDPYSRLDASWSYTVICPADVTRNRIVEVVPWMIGTI